MHASAAAVSHAIMPSADEGETAHALLLVCSTCLVGGQSLRAGWAFTDGGLNATAIAHSPPV